VNLQAPFIITPRLLAGLQIGNVFLSIEYSRASGRDGRTRYTYHIDKGSESYTSSESTAYARRTGRPGENSDLFPQWVAQWADACADEITCLQLEIEATPVPLLTE